MEILILAVVIVLIICIGIYIINAMKDKKENNRNKVLCELTHKDSNLYKFIYDNMNEAVEYAYFNGGGVLYDTFKDLIVKFMIDAVSDKIKKDGLGWICDKDVKHMLTKDNINESIQTILTRYDIKSYVTKLFIQRMMKSIAEAEEYEKKAVENNKEFDKAPGRDEELHPRIPNPGEDRDEEISEMSIEALTSTGTVENVD